VPEDFIIGDVIMPSDEESVVDIVCGKNPITANRVELGSMFPSRGGVPPARMRNIQESSLTS